MDVVLAGTRAVRRERSAMAAHADLSRAFHAVELETRFVRAPIVQAIQQLLRIHLGHRQIGPIGARVADQCRAVLALQRAKSTFDERIELLRSNTWTSIAPEVSIPWALMRSSRAADGKNSVGLRPGRTTSNACSQPPASIH